MARNPERRQRVGEKTVRIDEKRRDELAIRAAIFVAIRVEVGERVVEPATQDHRGSVVERMRHRRGRLDPAEAVVGEGQAAQPGRQDPERMDRRADVVDEARQRRFGAARAAAGPALRLEHHDLRAGLGDADRGGQAVGTGTHDDRVGRGHALAQGCRARSTLTSSSPASRSPVFASWRR